MYLYQKLHNIFSPKNSPCFNSTKKEQYQGLHVSGKEIKGNQIKKNIFPVNYLIHNVG